LDHMIRWEHTRGMGIGKKPKKHDSIWGPHCRGTNTETLKRQKSL
jgi:hypothetical protein